MKKLLLFALVATQLCGVIQARHLTSSEALKRALGQINGKSVAGSMTRSAGDLDLCYTQQGASSADALYYVYSLPEGGFMMAGGDDRSAGLLGYTDNGTFAAARQNPAFEAWLSSCQEALTWLSQQPETTTAPAISRAESTQYAAVTPLLGTTKWDQVAPYNNLCPKGESSEDHGATGCVATAMAQVMYYHRWPERGTGSHQNAECEEQTVDFSQSVYDWENMLPSYKGAYTEEQADAVARLMYDVGCSVNMFYGYVSTAANSSLMPALTTYFGYDKGMNHKFRDFYTSAQWAALLHAELEAQRPILFDAGTQRNEFHEFVIDGCDDQDLYHVNWGWGGLSDGYYSIDIMDPEMQGTGGSMGGYQFKQEAIIGIQKDKGSQARPDLVMNGSLQFNSTEPQSFTFWVYNFGLGDFTGCVGLKVLDSNRALKDKYYYAYKDQPISYFDVKEITIPLSDLRIDDGDYIEPFYTIDGKEVTADNMLALPAQLSAITCFHVSGNTLEEATPNIPVVSVSDIKVEECNVGSSPKISLTFSVADNSPVEYNDRVCINLYDAEGNRVARGHGSTYLQPGESKHIVIDSFLDDNNELYLLEAKDYAFHVLFYLGLLRYYLTEEPISFTAQQGEAPDITSVELSLASESVAKGETLKVTVKVTNEGGPTRLSYSLSLFPSGYYEEIDYKNFYMEAKAHDVTTTDVTMVINQEPGEYYLDLYDYNDGEWLCLDHYFTVTDPTAISSVSADSVHTSDGIYLHEGKIIIRRNGRAYTLSGQAIQANP